MDMGHHGDDFMIRGPLAHLATLGQQFRKHVSVKTIAKVRRGAWIELTAAERS